MAYRTVRVTPTITTDDYSSGDALGAIQRISQPFAGNRCGELVSIYVVDKADLKIPLNLIFFRDQVTAVADNEALDFSDADLVAKFAGFAKVAALSYISLADNAVVENALTNPIPITLPANKDVLFFQIQAAADIGADTDPSYASTSDLTFVFGFKYDDVQVGFPKN